MSSELKLECFTYRLTPPFFDLVPAAHDRKWMDDFGDRHPYRCLPLTIANTHGWDVLCPFSVTAEWNGGPKVEDIKVSAVDPEHAKHIEHVLSSNFSRGIITFHTGFLFRTSPGWNLMATGAINNPKKGVAPLTGIIETDWLPYTFTMNWQMMSPGKVTFEKGEPICTIMPIPKHYLLDVVPEIYSINDDMVLNYEQHAFRLERDKLTAAVDIGDEKAKKEGWQRHYFVGRMPDHTKIQGHVNKVRLHDPVDKTGEYPTLGLQEARAKIPEIPFEDYVDHILDRGVYPYDPARLKNMALFTKLGLPDKLRELVFSTQTKENIKGRERVHKGILTPGPHTRTITAADKDNVDFVIIEDFLSKDQVGKLMEAFQGTRHLLGKESIDTDYWKNRVLFSRQIQKEFPEAFKIMHDAHTRMHHELGKKFGFTMPVYADTVQLVHWAEGLFMPPHADNSNPDMTPHGMPWRAFGSIVYVNDDYEGGAVYFTALDAVVKPKAGMLLAFSGGMHHEHSVLKVTKGERITMPSFHTFDEKQADEAHHYQKKLT
jgi:predicted 2-oxoglutarate/Fe(II)-dependent dioxygenase YbiX